MLPSSIDGRWRAGPSWGMHERSTASASWNVLRLLRRAQYLLRRRRLEAELDEEMAFHRELAERDAASAGASPEDRAAIARKIFGSTALARNRARDVWIAPRLQDAAQDLR